jgi:hypothetical protein
MKQIKNMTQAEIAAYVQSHLRKKGITVILSGGATVSIYTSNKYVSADVDLVNVYFADRKKIKAAMEEIGFHEESRYFTHPDTKHIVEFPPGPLSVGNDPITDIAEIKFTTGILRVISPTESVKDRLASYYFWNDQQSLDQAVLVAKNNRINIDEIKRWSQALGNMKEFKIFLEKSSEKKMKPPAICLYFNRKTSLMESESPFVIWVSLGLTSQGLALFEDLRR